MDREGVIKFSLHTDHEVRVPHDLPKAQSEILGWCQVLKKMGWFGQDPHRYEGLGFGNISFRIGPRFATSGRRSFAITGSQAGARAQISKEDVALVSKYHLKQHTLWKAPGINPSSESLTHAAVYDGAPNARVCFHVHCPTVWQARHILGLPCIPISVRYGTPQMSAAIRSLCVRQKVGFDVPIAMDGHTDGLLCFSTTPERVFAALIQAYRASSG